ncbi:phosphotransferase family protein [Neobacillus rhizophilus]|uniref:Phosphotransferase n=1 Tax=Neobacillus rhizophilus TaxID=2833579 RepID=A0A942U0V0_9BACI|nr:phosphotransferase [Neobacillus rhizophilus]MBS4212481.1 phosphotransferase [Neobacillus rhizophilus]
MALPNDIVHENGSLNASLILKKERLYQGMNGRFVERFYLSPKESYIFKPLTNNAQMGKETWIHEHVLCRFPAIFPKILAYSKHDNPDLSWMILEDLGQLSHEFTEETVLGVVKWMAWWHSLPLESFPDVPLNGLKPRIEVVAEEVCENKDDLLRVLPRLGLTGKHVLHVFKQLDSFIFSKLLVLSHGDLHLGNYAVVKGKLIILDWEHTHLNTPFWDLYHLLDMAHPIFPKKVTKGFRKQVLGFYLGQVGMKLDGPAFVREYYLFSAVFSMWMILLIQRDLQADDGKWSKEQLKRQLEETVFSLRQCAEALADV